MKVGTELTLIQPLNINPHIRRIQGINNSLDKAGYMSLSGSMMWLCGDAQSSYVHLPGRMNTTVSVKYLINLQSCVNSLLFSFQFCSFIKVFLIEKNKVLTVH